MTKSLNSYDNMKKYIIPIIPLLSNLIKVSYVNNSAQWEYRNREVHP
jgi:hypothetical protein